jgi:hypothetical protein
VELAAPEQHAQSARDALLGASSLHTVERTRALVLRVTWDAYSVCVASETTVLTTG